MKFLTFKYLRKEKQNTSLKLNYFKVLGDKTNPASSSSPCQSDGIVNFCIGEIKKLNHIYNSGEKKFGS